MPRRCTLPVHRSRRCARARTCFLPRRRRPRSRPPRPRSRAEVKRIADPIDRIKDEGLNRSQLMATLSYLTDVIGPRLTGSPGLKRANEWTCQTLNKWGLSNAHLEAWGPFGKGWTLKRFSAQVIEPQCIPLIAFPKAWSPSTEGTLTAPVVYFDAKSEAEFDKFKGKIKGAIVLTGPPREVSARFEPLANRKTDKELLELADAAEPTPFRFDPSRASPATGTRPRAGRGPAGRQRRAGRRPAQAVAAAADPLRRGTPAGGQPPARRMRFGPEMRAQMELARKKVQVPRRRGGRAAGRLQLPGRGRHALRRRAPASRAPPGSPCPGRARGRRRVSAWDKDAPKIPPQIVVAKEHYNRLVRMIEQGEKLKMAVDLAVQFHDDDLMCYNTIAEIPGSDLKDEVVMLGGHIDSWHSGTGATDNAAGVAVAMEAVRILKALDLKPRRTVRIGLWSGEEQGLLGSRAYVAQHFGKSYDAMAAMFGSPGAVGGEEGIRRRQGRHAEPKPEYVEVLGLFQPRQRHRQDPRGLPPGQRGGPADLPQVAPAVPRDGCLDPDASPTPAAPTTNPSTASACRDSSSSRTTSTTTPGRTTPTRTSTTTSRPTT